MARNKERRVSPRYSFKKTVIVKKWDDGSYLKAEVEAVLYLEKGVGSVYTDVYQISPEGREYEYDHDFHEEISIEDVERIFNEIGE